jgi:hypothetical protein
MIVLIAYTHSNEIALLRQLSRVDDGVNEPQNVAILLLLPPSTNNEIVNYL